MTILGNKLIALVGDKSSADNMHADEPPSEKFTNDEENFDGNQVDHDSTIVPFDSIMDLSDLKSKEEYSGPMDEELAKTRMGDALFCYKWNLPADNENIEFLHNVCSCPILRCTVGTSCSNSANRSSFL